MDISTLQAHDQVLNHSELKHKGMDSIRALIKSTVVLDLPCKVVYSSQCLCACACGNIITPHDQPIAT